MHRSRPAQTRNVLGVIVTILFLLSFFTILFFNTLSPQRSPCRPISFSYEFGYRVGEKRQDLALKVIIVLPLQLGNLKLAD